VQIVQHLRTYTRGRRKLRFQHFIADLRCGERPLRIIDIGGTVPFWTRWWGLREEDGLHVTLVNDHIQDDTDDEDSNVPFLANLRTDATTLTEDDFSQYDCVFSNSCVEHLATWRDQMRMARTIMGSRLPYFVQVPNKFAPIDPHYPRPYVPFFGAYPKEVQRRLLTVSALGSGGRHTYATAGELLTYYNPLGPEDMRRLFPDAEVVVERPMGVPMSILAIRTKARVTRPEAATLLHPVAMGAA